MAEKLIGWRCTSCRWFMVENQRYCPRCYYTVYKPIYADPSQDSWGPGLGLIHDDDHRLRMAEQLLTGQEP